MLIFYFSQKNYIYVCASTYPLKNIKFLINVQQHTFQVCLNTNKIFKKIKNILKNIRIILCQLSQPVNPPSQIFLKIS